MRLCAAVSLIFLAHAAISQGEDLSVYPAKLNKAAADAEARSEHGRADVEAVCWKGTGTLHTAKYSVQWSPMGLRAEGVYQESFVKKDGEDVPAPIDRKFLAVFNKFENALWIQRGPNGALHRYGPNTPPLGLVWIKRSVAPAWYRTVGRYPINISVAEGELPNGLGRVTSRLLGESQIEFSYTYNVGASRSGKSIYDLEKGLIAELTSDDCPIQKNVWTQDEAGRFVPESIGISPSRIPPQFLPEECDGFEETFKFTAVDLDFEPADTLFEPEYLKLPLGTRVYIDKPGERRNYVVGEEEQAPAPQLPPVPPDAG